MSCDITVAIPYKDNFPLLVGCIESLGRSFATRIVVIDSNSLSSSQHHHLISAGIDVLTFCWNGKFPKKRNWFLLEHAPTTEWVLFLDADERLTPSVINEISESIHSTQYDAFLLDFNIRFFRRDLRFGYPLHNISLFRVGNIFYEFINEDSWSPLDMEIHEHPIVNGKVGLIRNKLEHSDSCNLHEYLIKHVHYANWESQRLINAPSFSGLCLKSRAKYFLLRSPFGPLLFFFYSYFFLRGFLDGRPGFMYSFLKMIYFYQVYALYLESRTR